MTQLDIKKHLMQNLLYIYWDTDPNIFNIPIINQPLRWYGLLWALGIYLAYKLLSLVFKKEGKPLELLDKMTMYIILGTMIGARLGHVLFYGFDYYKHHILEIFAVWHGGLASHGGGIGILFAILIFSIREKISFLWIADRIALVVPLCGGLIRIGNLMNSEIIGKTTDVPWAFIFARVDLHPRHPAQLYEAIFCFLLFGLLWYLYNKNVFKTPGHLFATLLTTLFTFRFIDEFFKINQEEFEGELLINMGQILSIYFIIIGLLIIVWKRKQTSQKAS